MLPRLHIDSLLYPVVIEVIRQSNAESIDLIYWPTKCFWYGSSYLLSDKLNLIRIRGTGFDHILQKVELTYTNYYKQTVKINNTEVTCKSWSIKDSNMPHSFHHIFV